MAGRRRSGRAGGSSGPAGRGLGDSDPSLSRGPGDSDPSLSRGPGDSDPSGLSRGLGDSGPVDSGPSDRGPSDRRPSDRGQRDGARGIGRGDSDRRADGGTRCGQRASRSATRRAEIDADSEAIARQICLRLLTVAPRTKAQLAAALRRRGVPEDAIVAVLARFAEVKLIDDELFARAWVESRHHGRGLAGRALGAELRQRGVASDDIAAALSQLAPEQELATARELVQRRLPGTAGMPTIARMRRLAGLLARKGYSAGLAYRVVREALERESADGALVGYDLDELFEPVEEESVAAEQ